MKMKQAGLIKKPMYVVPNHLLEQFSREFMQLYPNARLLVAAKEDLTRDRRKFLTAKIASGEWDGIIVTHSSFERIGMSRDYQEKFLLEQIAEYDQLLREHAGAKGANRNLIKTIEKQKAARCERLKDLLAEDKKDDGLVFDELGVDHIFIDEAHYFKNLETPTKMERVAGIQTGGSERAFDVYMKARYLDEQHAGHGVTFATGTPISNTMVEMYTMQRFLDPEGLREPRPGAFRRLGGHLRRSHRHHGNLPGRREPTATQPVRPLHQPAGTPADVPGLLRRADGRDAQPAAATPGRRQAHRRRLPDVRRAARPPAGTGGTLRTPAVAEGRSRESITRSTSPPTAASSPPTQGCSRATAPDFPESKVNRLVENVAAIWKRTAATRGTQMIFCRHGRQSDALGLLALRGHHQKAGRRRHSRASRSPPSATPNPTPRNRPSSRRSGNGSVRVLIGSTQKMGTGTNVQKRLVALHHLDAPWKPAEVEQREGRILRQGNENEEVAIYRYVTEGSFDAYMWQALETKARFIGQVITGDNAARRAEDIGGQELSYAEVKAIASGNPAVLTLAEADAELQRLTLLKKNHLDEQYVARRSVRDLPGTIASLSERLSNLTADQATATAHADDPITIGKRRLLPRGRRRRSGRSTGRLARQRPRDNPRSARHLSRPALRHGPSSAVPAGGVSRRSDHAPSTRCRATITGRVPS